MNNKDILKAIVSGKPIKAEEIRRYHEECKTESEVQQSCIEWFGTHYPDMLRDGILFHIPNEGLRSGRMGNRLKREGMVKGVADLCLAVPRGGYGALYIEMKKHGGYQRPEQKVWQAACEKYGNRYVVCKSLDDFKAAIESYFALNKN